MVLDVNNAGRQLSSLNYGDGMDMISDNARLAHLHLPGTSSATLAILDVSKDGTLSLLGVADTARIATSSCWSKTHFRLR